MLILGGYALYLLPQFLSIGGAKGFCMFHSLTGLPCPGCGMGRASILLSQGKLLESIWMHPLAIPFALASVIAILWLISDLILKRETLLPLLKRKLQWPYSLLLTGVVLAVWFWNIVREFY
jgi:hypothetical protein